MAPVMTSTTVTATRPWLRESAPFLLTTFGISWGIWALCLALGGDLADPATYVLWVVGTFGPTLAALARAFPGPARPAEAAPVDAGALLAEAARVKILTSALQ